MRRPPFLPQHPPLPIVVVALGGGDDDDDDDDDDDGGVDRQLVRMGYRLLVRGCKGL